MILVIDNYDSFVHNLARHLALAGWNCEIARNDALTVAQVEAMNPKAVVMSPGPRAPRDSGICIDLIKKLGPSIPMLGVCLGHQCVAESYGARIVRAANPMHGKASLIRHNGDALFEGIPNSFKGGRYHSLIVEMRHPLTCPLIITAATPENEIMAVRHETHPVYGVQFHPESILTDHGMDIIRNFTKIALAWQRRRDAA